MRAPFLALPLALACSSPASAIQDSRPDEKKEAEKKDEDKKDKATPAPKSFTSAHVGTFHDKNVAYTATVSETILENDKHEPEASIWSTAYVKDGVEDPAERAVTFLWNGGPGSASLWLHMGAFGPKRVDVPSDARDDGGPPYGLLDNTGTFLDVSDIVFIDPVGTGFSHTLEKGEGKAF